MLYLHGAIGTTLEDDPQLAAFLAQRRIRMIMVSRPGFGGSDPRPGRAIIDFAADVAGLADRLAIDRFALLGVSAGGPYALACALALGDRITATAAVSCLTPGPAPHDGRGLPVHVRAGLGFVVRHPARGERWAARGLRIVERHPAVVGRLARCGTPAADRAHLDVAAGARHAVEAFLAAAGGHPRGLIDDYRLCCSPWGFEPHEVRAPVHLWHGGEDRLVPVARARALAAALPDCVARIDDTDGHFFFRRRQAEILSALVPARRRRASLLRRRVRRDGAARARAA